MSRIYGVRSRQLPDASGRRLAHLVSRAATAAGWVYETREVGPCALGWAGVAPRTGAAAIGPITVLVDGHVLNRQELLPGADNDATALGHSYLRKGFEAMLHKVAGEVAVALYDSDDDVLWVARDRLGAKPVYYTALSDGSFAFASQPATLLGLPGVSATPNREYVARFAGSHARSFDDEGTESAFAAISQLPAGHLLEVRHSGVRVRRWWKLEANAEGGVERRDAERIGASAALAEQYRDLLMNAVGQRLDVVSRPAFALSGGLNSSSILSTAVAVASGDRQIAYTSIHGEPTFDESADLAPIRQQKVLSWHGVTVDEPDLFALVDEMVSIHNEPVARPASLSNFLVARAAAAHGRDALFGGTGGDEINAGGFEYFPYYFADLRAAGEHDLASREIDVWALHHDHPIWPKSPAVAENLMVALLDQGVPGRVHPNRVRLDRYAHVVSRDWSDLHGFSPHLDHPFTSYLSNRAYQDLFRETVPGALRANDRQSTAFGLSAFDPFIDHRVVEFMFAVAGTAKIADGITEVLLRKAMAGVLPDQTRGRIAKTGWNAPSHLWFAGRNGEPLLDLIRSSRFRDRGIYDIAKVEALVREHSAIVDSGAQVADHTDFFWQLVNLDRWLCWADVQDQMMRRAA